MDFDYYKYIPDWFDFATLFDQVMAVAQPNSVFVEIGSFPGKSVAYIASRIKKSNKNIKFYVVDIWDLPEGIEAGWRQNSFQQFLSAFHEVGVSDVVRPIQMRFSEASKLFGKGSIEFVFVDTCHGKPFLVKDIESWFPKIKFNGTFASYDCGNNELYEAARQYFVKRNVVRTGNCFSTAKMATKTHVRKIEKRGPGGVRRPKN